MLVGISDAESNFDMIYSSTLIRTGQVSFECVFDEYSLKKIMCIRLFLKCQMSGFIYKNKCLKIEDPKHSLNMYLSQLKCTLI